MKIGHVCLSSVGGVKGRGVVEKDVTFSTFIYFVCLIEVRWEGDLTCGHFVITNGTACYYFV